MGEAAKSVLRWAVILILSNFLDGCAASSHVTQLVPPLRNQPELQLADLDPLAITPAMRDFVDQVAPDDGKAGGRALDLVAAALDPSLLAFKYDPDITLTASEAFARRTGNCLTFSNMFVAMARAAGLEAWFQEVRTPPRWNDVSGTMLVSMHVNAVVRDSGMQYVLDVSRRQQNATDQSRKISDREARAQFYNNLGAEALIREDLPEAHAWFAKALEVDRQLPYVWSNLGVVLRRNDQAEDAKTAYKTALRIDSQHSVALNNLYVIYADEGNEEAAARLLRKVERIRRNNPYYLHYMAQVASEEQRYDDAIALLKRAIRLESREYLFHYSLARAELLAGRPAVARSSLQRAQQLAPASAGTLSLD